MLSVLSRHESQMVLIGDTLHDAEVERSPMSTVCSSPTAISRKSG